MSMKFPSQRQRARRRDMGRAPRRCVRQVDLPRVVARRFMQAKGANETKVHSSDINPAGSRTRSL